MTYRGLMTLQLSAAFLIMASAAPSFAIDLGDTVGGVTNTVSGATGSSSGSSGGGTTVDAGVASVTVGGGDNGGVQVDVDSNLNDGTTATVNVLDDQNVASANIQSGDLLNANLSALGSNGVIKANAKALNNSVKARLDVLTRQDLLKICLTIGAGPACGDGSDRAKLLNAIYAHLEVLQPRQLLSLCLNIGASGCGIVDPGNGGGGGGSDDDDGTVPPIIASMSDSEIALRQRQCDPVLKRPFEYERDLVDLCELLRDIRDPS